MKNDYRFNTQCIHAGVKKAGPFETLHTPIYLTSNYRLPTDDTPIDGETTLPGLYSRNGNENQMALEGKLAALEGADDCAVYASGVAALGAIFFTFLHSGDHVVCSRVCYTVVRRLFTEVMPEQFDITISFVDTTDLNKIKEAIKPNTKLVHVETPGNPSCQISDIAAICDLVKGSGILVSVDNTFASPWCQKPLSLGADLSVSSLTKYCNGHGDALGGCIMGRKDLIFRLKKQATCLYGGVLSPFNSWLISRGLVTLPLRMAQHSANAMTIAKYLEGKEQVRFISYPGLESHPQHELAARQMKNGFSGMIAFGLIGGPEISKKFMDSLKLIVHAVSLGDSESLICYTDPDSNAMPYYPDIMKDGFFRLSVGLENVEDIIEDFEQAFNTVFDNQ